MIKSASVGARSALLYAWEHMLDISRPGIFWGGWRVNGCCQRVLQKPWSGVIMCVRRSGVLGLEMKTLPVKCWLVWMVRFFSSVCSVCYM